MERPDPPERAAARWCWSPPSLAVGTPAAKRRRRTSRAGRPRSLPTALTPTRTRSLLDFDDAQVRAGRIVGGLGRPGSDLAVEAGDRRAPARCERCADATGGTAAGFPAPRPPRAATSPRSRVTPGGDTDTLSTRAAGTSPSALDVLLPETGGQRAGIDDGDNLMQRGLFGGSGQFKLQIDGGRPSCRVAGDDGEVLVKATGAVELGTVVPAAVRADRRPGRPVRRHAWTTSGDVTWQGWSEDGTTGDIGAGTPPATLSVAAKLNPERQPRPGRARPVQRRCSTTWCSSVDQTARGTRRCYGAGLSAIVQLMPRVLAGRGRGLSPPQVPGVGTRAAESTRTEVIRPLPVPSAVARSAWSPGVPHAGGPRRLVRPVAQQPGTGRRGHGGRHVDGDRALGRRGDRTGRERGRGVAVGGQGQRRLGRRAERHGDACSPPSGRPRCVIHTVDIMPVARAGAHLGPPGRGGRRRGSRGRTLPYSTQRVAGLHRRRAP